ncbi:MAG: tetraacyldisaccharide 4'-kinase [Gammaproteobacteria bacterium]|nr:tetraacyldisaccharide 4'-kinase [Gammaproteobacteria bacterium]
MIDHDLLDRIWYGNHWLSALLAPLGWGYAAAVWLRHTAFLSGLVPVRDLPVPVIVVGNVTVGGTGKTPLVIWLVEFLLSEGWRPGIVSRGYGGRMTHHPQQVRPDSSPDMVGDEPVLIAQRTRRPVAVCTRRTVAAEELIRHTDCDIIVCDDGLQHLALGRDVEIAVIDGDRRFGNGRCLPAGPLRDLPGRVQSVDLVVANGRAARGEFLMEYGPLPLRSLRDPARTQDVGALKGRDVHAVAGIGNPARFFSFLRRREIHIVKHEFPDHHRYQPADLLFEDHLPVVMTEKDAVKCREFATDTDEWWYLPVEARMPDAFPHRLRNLLREIANGQKAA